MRHAARTDAPSDEYVVLMSVLKHFVSHVKELDAVVPPCRLIASAIDVVETCVRFQIERVFRRLRAETIELLANAHYEVNHLRQSSRTQSHSSTGSSNSNSSNASGMSVRPAAQEAARTFTDMMQQVLRQMEPLAQTGASILRDMSRLFSDLVQVQRLAWRIARLCSWLTLSVLSLSHVLQSQFYGFLKWFNASVLTYTDAKRAFTAASDASDDEPPLPWLEPTPPFLLFLACLCHELATDGIGECIQLLVECLPAPPPSSSSVQSPSTSALASPSKQLDVAHMVQVTRETSSELLQHVARSYGHALCALLAKGMDATSWSDMDDEPRSVQEMVVAVIDATFRFNKELALALGDDASGFVSGFGARTGSRDFRRRTSGLKSRSAGDSAGIDIERIFAKRIQIFQAPPPARDVATDWFAQAMLKMAIKALGELVRATELSKFGLQQIQVNAEFLRVTTAHVVAPELHEPLESLLSDVLSNARERSLEDVLMEQSSVVAIVSTKSAQVLSRKA